MLKLKDLTNRQYVGKQCKMFDYVLRDNEGVATLIARFENKEGRAWSAQFVLNRSQISDGQIYWIDFAVPKDGMPLEIIAATGLRLFQVHLKEEIQAKISMDFDLSEKLEGM